MHRLIRPSPSSRSAESSCAVHLQPIVDVTVLNGYIVGDGGRLLGGGEEREGEIRGEGGEGGSIRRRRW